MLRYPGPLLCKRGVTLHLSAVMITRLGQCLLHCRQWGPCSGRLPLLITVLLAWTPCKWKQSLHSLRVIHNVRDDPFCVFVVFVFLLTLVCVTFAECFLGSRSHWWLGLNQNRPCVRGRMSEYFMGCEPTLGQRCSNKLCFVKRLLSWPVPSTLARSFYNFTILDSALYFSLLSCAFSLTH